MSADAAGLTYTPTSVHVLQITTERQKYCLRLCCIGKASKRPGAQVGELTTEVATVKSEMSAKVAELESGLQAAREIARAAEVVAKKRAAAEVRCSVLCTANQTVYNALCGVLVVTGSAQPGHARTHHA